MRITFLDQYSFLGGGQIILISLIKSLDKASKIHIIFPKGGNLEKKIINIQDKDIKCHNINENDFKYDRRNYFTILNIFKNNIFSFIRYFDIIRSTDLIYCNGPRLFIFAILASTLLKKKCNYYIHSKYTFFESILVFFISRLKYTNKIIFCSNYLFSNFRNNIFSLNERKISIIDNGLSEEFDRVKFKNRFLFSKYKGLLRFAIVGTLKPEKGQDVVLLLSKRFPKIEFFLIGKESKKNKKWIDSIKSQKSANIFFQRELLNIRKFVNKNMINIFLVPSEWEEPFGLVAIEGMSLSCITIVKKRGGLIDIAKNTGALVYSNEIELIEIIENLNFKSHKELVELSNNQYLKTKRFYSFKNFSNEIRKTIPD